MFESNLEHINLSVNRGTNFGTHNMETEITHRVPPSDEGWCLHRSNLTWWDGRKGIALTLLLGRTKDFSDLLGRGVGYKDLAKFKIPNLKHLNEIHCSDQTGLLDRCWLISEPQLVEKVILRVSLHQNWSHLYLVPSKGKILGGTDLSPRLESVRTDPQVFESLIGSILGKT